MILIGRALGRRAPTRGPVSRSRAGAAASRCGKVRGHCRRTEPPKRSPGHHDHADPPSRRRRVRARHQALRRDDGEESTPGAVNDLSLTVPAGKICVLVGPSGCGKTTSPQDGQPAHRADVAAGSSIDGVDAATQRRHRAAPEHRLRHPAGRSLPAPDHRRERRDGAAPPGLDQGAPAGARRGAARARRPGPGQVPRPLPEPAVRRRAPAGRASPGPWPSTRRSCSWTSRSARSTRSSATASRTSSSASRRRSPRRSCS